MRDLSATDLEAYQKKDSLNPLVKIVLTHNGTTVTLREDRILNLPRHHEEPYDVTCEMVLDNSDKYFTDLNLQGYDAVIGYGLLTKNGEEFSDTSPLKVIAPRLDSAEGKLTCTLIMAGIPNMLAEDKASESYVPDADDTKTVKTLIREVAGDTGVTHLACFNHTQKYDVVFDSEDDLISTFKPKDNFTIYIGARRLAIIRRLLDYTHCVPRWGADGRIHILKPKIDTQTAWQASTGYSLRDQVVPTTLNNYQYICTTAGTSGATEPIWPTGIGDTVNDGDVVWTVAYDYEYSLEDHIFFSKAYRKTLVIPNKIIFHSLKDADPFYSGEATDTASYNLLPKEEYHEYRAFSHDEAADLADAVLSKYQLNAEMGAANVSMNVGAEIFDYVKVTDAREGDYRVGNIGSLTRTYSPGKYTLSFSFGAWLTVRKILSDLEVNSPFDLERLSVRHLYAEDILLDDIVDTATYRRTKYTAINADGMVILDQVIEGDYGLVASTDISAGHIKLDTVEAEGTYGLVLSTDISSGHIKLSEVDGDLDDIANGTYGKVRATEISSGHIKLTTATVVDGKWYDTTGVEIDANDGIKIKGGSEAYPFLRFYYGASYKGGMWVSGSTLKVAANTLEIFTTNDILIYTQTANKNIRITGGTTSGKVVLDASFIEMRANIFPDVSNSKYCGSSALYWYAVYANHLRFKDWAVFQKYDDIELIRRIKPKAGTEKVDMDTVPDEIKEDGFFNLGAVSGLAIGAIKQLADRVDALEAKRETPTPKS